MRTLRLISKLKAERRAHFCFQVGKMDYSRRTRERQIITDVPDSTVGRQLGRRTRVSTAGLWLRLRVHHINKIEPS